MKWPRIRFTVRRMMVLLLVLGVAMHLGLTAWRVERSRHQWKNLHVHTVIIDNNDDPCPSWIHSLVPAPFWPSYERALLGRSWKNWPLDRPLCRNVDPRLLERGFCEEWCELAQPVGRNDPDANRISVVFTKEQKDLYIQLARKKGCNVDYDENGDVFLNVP